MKNKQKDNQKLKGKEAFEEYYKEIYGSRWDLLKESFSKQNQSVEYKIPGSDSSYFLDSASVFAALNLPVKNAKRILDMCAAPGGKTLVLASRMDDDAVLYANERSPERKKRLDNVVRTCTSLAISERIKTSCSDASSWCKKQTECYDRILLDAPCSSERHVYLDSKYLNIWTKSRIKTVSMEQWALLSCAYRLLEPEGILLYSTCALSPSENDEIMKKLIKKFNKEEEGFKFLNQNCNYEEIKSFVKMNLPGFEKTEYGFIILPDIQNGAGPIYFSIIQKIKSINS